jgi:pyruvate formate lyase activating enzyme
LDKGRHMANRNASGQAHIYNIQHFCTHDGPGIRTVVFFKGCQLKCGWCANPESQNLKDEIGFFRDKCRMCGACQPVCGPGAIDIHSESRINRSLCTRCGKCAEVCPHDAYTLFGEYKTCDQLLERVLRDRPFYRKSGGGVTASGGEPTLHMDFLIQFFHALKREGIHTALETHGFVPTEMLGSLAECTDIFLFDIKHMDSSMHKRFTGVPNELILQNIHELAVVHRADVVMRVPLIPGFNDDDDNLKATAQLARRLSQEGTLKGVHLLKFHSMASNKYAALERKYAYETIVPYTAEQFDHIVGTFRSEYPDAVIGG